MTAPGRTYLVCYAGGQPPQIPSCVYDGSCGPGSNGGGNPGQPQPPKPKVPKPQKPKSPARKQCEANAANKYQNTFAAVDKGFFPKAGKSAAKQSLWGAGIGCAVTIEIGCAEGGLPGWAIGGLSGASKSMWDDLYDVGMAYLQYRDEMNNVCAAIP